MSGSEAPRIDPDVDLHLPAERGELRARRGRVLAAIAAGGVLGALARQGLQAAYPHRVTAFPWATFGVNVSGCLLLGVLMVLLAEVWPGRPLLRPFLGVGVLGGYTTFSTYVVDIQQAVSAGAAPTALAYLAATLAGAMIAVWTGTALTTRALAAYRAAGTRGRRR